MTRKAVLVIGVLAFAVPAMAVGISYTENWDGYISGSGNRFLSPYSDPGNWPTTTGYTDRQVIDTAKKLSLPNSMLLDNGSSYPANMGVTHELGGLYAATAANPIVVQWAIFFQSNTIRKTVDIFVELALDDIADGTLSNPSARNAIGVAQSKTVRGGTGSAKGQWYDGTHWFNTGAGVAATWTQTVTMTITDANVTVAYSNGVGTFAGPRTYLGNFDQINIRHPYSGTSGAAWLDDLSITGGELVPEPATLLLLGLGGLFLRRRTA